MVSTTALNHQILSRPQVNAKIFNKRCTLLYDTGSSISLVRPEVIQNIDQKRRIQPPPNLRITSASGDPLDVSACYVLPVEIKCGDVLEFPFFVCRNLTAEGIIGIDMIRIHHLNYDSVNNEVIRGLPKVTLRKRTILPPNSQVKTKIRTTIRGTQVVNVISVENPDIETGSFLVNEENGIASIAIRNHHSHPVELPRGYEIGTASPVKTNDRIIETSQPTESQCASVNFGSGAKFPAVTRKPEILTPQKRKLIQDNAIIGDEEGDGKLSEQEKQAYKNLLLKYHDAIGATEFEVGTYNGAPYQIPVQPGTAPIYNHQFPLPKMQSDEVKRHVEEWVKKDICEKAQSLWNNPLFVVKKDVSKPISETNSRVVVDMRSINKHIVPQVSRLPTVAEHLRAISAVAPNTKVWASIDLLAGFYQILLDPKSRQMTGFTIPLHGQYQFKRLPMGMTNSPWVFQRVMERVLDDLIKKNLVHLYLDDLLIGGRDHVDLRNNIKLVLEAFQKNNLKLSLKKSKFGVSRCKFLGFEITKAGITPGKKKTEAILRTPPPRTLKEVRSFLGCCNYFRGNIHNFSRLARGLVHLTTKKSNYTRGPIPPDALRSYRALQHSLASQPVINYPDFSRKFYLFCDGSLGRHENDLTGGLGGALLQFENEEKLEGPRCIGFCSRGLRPHEKNYSATLIEKAAIVFAIDNFADTLSGRDFIVYSDHRPIENIQTRAYNKRTLCNLQEKLLDYSFQVKYLPGKDNKIADWLSRLVANREPPASTCATATTFGHTVSIETGTDKLKKYAELQRLCPIAGPIVALKQGQKLPKCKQEGLVKRLEKSCELDEKSKCLFINFYYNRRNRRLLFAPCSIQAEIVAKAHVNSGHLAFQKTKDNVLEHYFWPGLDADIQNFIDACAHCLRDKKKPPKRNTNLQALPQTSTPFERCHLDLMGPLFNNEREKKYVMVVICALTKFAEFIVLPNKTATAIAEQFFNRIVLRYGTPAVLTTDRAQELIGETMKKLCDFLNIKQSKTSGYQPNSNGEAEAVNKFVAKYLRAFLKENSKNWETLMGSLQFSYNSGVHSALKMSPLLALIGAQPNNILNDASFSDLQMYGDDPATTLVKRLQKIRQLAIKNNIIYRDMYIKNFNKNVKEVEFSPGMLVWLYAPQKRKLNRKIEYFYFGPYLVESTTETNAMVRDLQTGKTLFVHKEKLRPYHHHRDTDRITEMQRRNAEEEQTGKRRTRRQTKAQREPNLSFSHLDTLLNLGNDDSDSEEEKEQDEEETDHGPSGAPPPNFDDLPDEDDDEFHTGHSEQLEEDLAEDENLEPNLLEQEDDQETEPSDTETTPKAGASLPMDPLDTPKNPITSTPKTSNPQKQRKENKSGPTIPPPTPEEEYLHDEALKILAPHPEYNSDKHSRRARAFAKMPYFSPYDLQKFLKKGDSPELKLAIDSWIRKHESRRNNCISTQVNPDDHDIEGKGKNSVQSKPNDRVT